MRADRPDIRQRHHRSLLTGRDLADRLAREAEEIAGTLEHLAELHEQLAVTAGHPLAEGAAARAAGEREMARRERLSSVWFRQIASRPVGDAGPSAGGNAQRLPSQ